MTIKMDQRKSKKDVEKEKNYSKKIGNRREKIEHDSIQKMRV
jgi:hypothetical protein